MSRVIDLDDSVTQARFAEIIGTSQQRVSDRIVTGVLREGGSLGEWLFRYCERLREEAAGRTGEDHDALTRARTAEARASADLKQLQIAEKAGQLVPVAEIEPQITAMIVAARTELLAMADKVYADIKALYDIEIDPAIINDKVYAALEHMAASDADGEAT